MALPRHVLRWQIRGLAEALADYRNSPAGLSADLEAQLKAYLELLEHVRKLAPDVVARGYRRAVGRMLHYMARRAIRMGQGPDVVRHYLVQALRMTPALMVKTAADAGHVGRRFHPRNHRPHAPGRSSPSALSIGRPIKSLPPNDRVGDLLGRHQRREIGVGRRHDREHRGIDDAQALHAAHPARLSVTAIGSPSAPMRQVHEACQTPIAAFRTNASSVSSSRMQSANLKPSMMTFSTRYVRSACGLRAARGERW